jgi:predicted metal-dependent enzyme (double-stranded beta helix superfamily)
MDGDVYHVHGPRLERFIDEVWRIAAAEQDRAKAVEFLRPAFGDLLRDDTWLPTEFAKPDPSGGMGAGIGNYLIFRSGSRDLSLMSLVLAAGASTPVHDHLAWGLVGLYRGEQTETIYRQADTNQNDDESDLIEIEQRHLYQGDFYELLPPEGDIHRVTTLGNDPSVSIHLLGNDIGCVWRHRYDPESGHVYPFRSGYTNETCSDDGQDAGVIA